MERSNSNASLKKELKLSQGHEITWITSVKDDRLDNESGAAELQILGLDSSSPIHWLATICRSQLEQVNAVYVSI